MNKQKEKALKNKELEYEQDNVDVNDNFHISCRFKEFNKPEAILLAKKIARFTSENIYDTKNRIQKVIIKLFRDNKKKLDKPELMYWTNVKLEGSPLTGWLEDEREK